MNRKKRMVEMITAHHVSTKKVDSDYSVAHVTFGVDGWMGRGLYTVFPSDPSGPKPGLGRSI